MRELDYRPGSSVVAIALTTLLHAGLLLAWLAARAVQLPDDGGPSSFIQWVRLPAGVPFTSRRTEADIEVRPPLVTKGRAVLPRTAVDAHPDRPRQTLGRSEEMAPPMPSASRSESLDTTFPAVGSAGLPSKERIREILEHAGRDAGVIARTMRKETNPFIVAPPDSPQIRMQKKFDEAAALAPNRLWEAPKMVELVNDSGDGARRTRVITAAGIYCITERSPATSIDIIEKSGKLRITNCGHEHEQSVNAQDWRTARDGTLVPP